MKLFIQIPCFDEEQQLPATLAELPREMPGFESVEWLIIDDGSRDRTVEVARAGGVDHIVRLTNNKGLAAAFQARLDACLKLGADVIVNTDADNQYQGNDISQLVAPDRRRSRRHGRRRPSGQDDRALLAAQEGAAAARLLGRPRGVRDTRAGRDLRLRAYNREAALQVQAVSKFTYTLETLIQAGKLTVAIDSVANPDQPEARESRLFPSMGAYVRRNAISIFRIYSQYEPLTRLLERVGRARPRRAGDLHPLPGDIRPGPEDQRAYAVADPWRRPVQCGDAAWRARRDRRPAGGASGRSRSEPSSGSAGSS